MEERQSMVKAEKLCYEYTYIGENDVEKTRRALDSINIDVKKGDFVAVLGRNGSGKSTFARHINSLLYPTSGTLVVAGFDATREENSWEIRKRAGMIFQNPDNQLVASVVEEDVAFGPENLGLPSEEIRRRVDQALEEVGMAKYASSAPHKMSGGQKQRVAIAGVLAMRTQCIILDEPTAMLDPKGRKRIMEVVHRINKEEGITVIHITHYLEEALNADYIYVVDGGRVVLEGKPKEVFVQNELLEKAGLEPLPMQAVLLEMKKMGLGDRLPKDILTIDEMVEGIRGLNVNPC